MAQRFLIGLDIGGSGGRCLLIDCDTGETTNVLKSWSHPIVPDSIGYYDLDTNNIWDILCCVVKDCTKNIDVHNIVAISVTSVRYGLVVVNEQHQVVFAVPNIDGRAAMTGAQLGNERGEEFYQRTGHWPFAVSMGARLLELSKSQPEILEKAHAALSISDWINLRLCGELATEYSQASGSLLFDIQTNNWAWDLIDSLQLPRHIFPKILEAGCVLGKLPKSVADELGLVAEIPIVTAGGDTQSALLGAGAITSQQLCVVAGTTAPVQLVLDKPVCNSSRLWTERHIVPGLWVVESNAGPLGNTLQRMADILAPNHPNNVALISAEAQQSYPGAGGVVSTMGVELFDAHEVSLPMGSITLSAMLHPKEQYRHHFARSLMEGAAFGIYANIQQIVEAAGGTPQIRVTGGISQSKMFLQILSDLCNAVIEKPTLHEASALGAAICAGVGAKIFANLSEGCEKLISISQSYTPNQENHLTYSHLYSSWKNMLSAGIEAKRIASEMAIQAASELPVASSSQNFAFSPRIYVSADLQEQPLQQLRRLGEVHYASYREEMQLLTGEALVEALKDYHIFICEVDVLDAEALQNLPNLRAVVSCRGNAVNIDKEACTTLGIPVLNTPGRNANAVADITVGFALMLARDLNNASKFLYSDEVEAGDMAKMGMAHKQFQGHELWRKTFGLVGMGAVGKKVIERLLPFGCRILVYDPYVDPQKIIVTGAEPASLEQLLKTSDFVSLHAAVTPETRHMIGESQLSQMKSGSFLINTARAALVEEDALLQALESRHLAGAALDVFAQEPPGYDHPLLQLDNVIATPHIGGNTHDVSNHQGMIAVEDIKSLLCGKTPKNILNPEVLAEFCWSGERKKVSAQELERLAQNAGPGVTDLEIESKVQSKSQPKSESHTQAAPKTTSPNIVSAPQNKSSKGLFSRIRSFVSSKEVPEEPTLGHSQSQKMIQHFEKILKKFLELAVDDSALQKFSEKQDIAVHYVIPDSQQDFGFIYRHGNIITSWGVPEYKPDVVLKMKAYVLDGSMSGSMNAMRAAMTGKLSFSGDTVKAMRLQKIAKDMIRLYNTAREEFGDPGDLKLIAPAISSDTPIPQKSTENPVSAVSKTNDERDEIVAVVNELYELGLITSTGGNVSARNLQNNKEVWITPSRIAKGSLQGNMMVRINLEGDPLDKNALTPSSERLIHTYIFQQRPDVQAVIHSHAPKAIALVLNELPFLPISTEAAFIGEIPRIPFLMPGSKKLAQAVVDALGQGPAVLMQNHGLVVAASDLQRAIDITKIIEQTAEQILTAYSMGKKPPVLPDDALEVLKEIGEMFA